MLEVGKMYEEFGQPPVRILHVTEDEVFVGSIEWALPPSKKKKRRRHALAPCVCDRKDMEALLESADATTYDLEAPEHWRLQEEAQVSDRAPRMLSSRRKIERWIEKRDRKYRLIEPLVAEYLDKNKGFGTIYELALFRSWPKERARELGIGAAPVYDALHRFLIGGGKKALMPCWQFSSGKGARRYAKERPGRRNTEEEAKAEAGGTAKATGYVLRPIDVVCIENGCKRHLGKGVTEYQAYVKTLNDFYCKKKAWTDDGLEVVELKSSHPSFSQFRYQCRRGELPTVTEVQKGRINMKSAAHLRAPRSKHDAPRVFLEGEMDSTSTNQNLVSEASSLTVLPAPWRTVLVDTAFNYILGVYVGFEKPSALTAKLALLNAMEDKVKFCEQYGIKILKEDWLSGTCRNIIVDNGEAKSRDTLEAVQEMEGSLTFPPTNFGEGKPSVETSHRVTQTKLDNLTVGSTQGRMRERGEPDPALSACNTFFEYMPELLRQILHHNNVELYHPPFTEMRRGDYEHTRRGAMLWALKMGYRSSHPNSIDELRTRCLPKLRAAVGRRGLELLDPTVARDSILNGLVYWSEDPEFKKYIEGRQRRLDVYVNPASVAQVWIDGPKLVRVPLHSSDPLLKRLSLFDLIGICKDDKLRGYLYRKIQVSRDALAASRRDALALLGKKRKAEEMAKLPKKPSKKSLTANKDANLQEEQTFLIAEAFGQKVLTSAKTGRPVLFGGGVDPSALVDPLDALLTEIREASHV